ncbi:MAG: PLP-dependent aminotransferase family protein [Microlunatus sp.]
MELFLDPGDRRPRAIQLYDQLRDAIADGRLGPGDRLTPTRIAAHELGVSRSTVTEAYGRLAAEGYIEGRAGGGSVVAAVTRPIPSRPASAALQPTARAASVEPYASFADVTARYDCRPGRMDPSLFPMTAWRRCMMAALDRSPGHYGDSAGSPDLRAALAHWVVRSRGVTATEEQLFVTAGAGHAVDLVARVLLNPGDVVAVEEPGYPVVTALLRSHGLHVLGVPVDDEGIVVDSLPARTKLVYVTPSHQFPLGMVMSRRRRCELLDWASANGAAVIEDDYDSEFRYTARPLEPLQRLDRDGRVLYVGTFAKTLSAGLRLGFLVAPTSLLPALRAIRQVSDWCPPTATQSALTDLITGGHLDRHLRRARTVYAERHRLMWEAMGELLPGGYQRLPAAAGLHLTVRADHSTHQESVETRNALRRQRVLYSPLEVSYQFSAPSTGYLLGFGGVPTRDIVPAVRAFTAALAR